MKRIRRSMDGLVLSLVIMLGAGSASKSNAVTQPAEVVIQDIFGTASYSAGGTWQPLKKDMKLSQGAIIKTAADSTVDLMLYSSFTALRLTPNSSLRLDKLHTETGYLMPITDTILTLLSGSIAGAQRKLAAPSRFHINVAGGVATIVGTEYFVRADGAVSVTSGTVSLNYNLPGNGGSVKVTVSAGFSFDPTTGRVVATTSAYLQNIIAHITTTSHNAQVFKVGGATLVVKPEEFVSPFSPDHGNNGVGNGVDPQPPGNPPVNDGPGTSPGNPGNKGGKKP
jgi:hypothetical protein